MGAAGRAAALAGVALAGVATWRGVHARLERRRRDAGERWRVVTVLASPERLAEDAYPEPLRSAAPALEIRTAPAPGMRGIELSARMLPDAAAAPLLKRLTGMPPADAVRTVLRDTKQVLEAGEVLRVDPRPHGHRAATPFGAVVDGVEQAAKGKGIL
ncbi:hypothetical protein [Naasia sp. SYSU D00057]|uniref:hypothetical protein n=1 Tax=Naasia sp. SYSU D00057 TaxID=2817380 RepID=UPI001B30D965|nr:hypothetical protein [Naasia sp. SYSU D00057]